MRSGIGNSPSDPLFVSQANGGVAGPSGSAADPYYVSGTGSQYYTDSAAALGSNATFTGTSRDVGGTAGTAPSRYNFFAAEAHTDVAGGTLYIDRSTDNATWRQTASVASVANTAVQLSVRITAKYYRVRYVNGATANTAFLLTSALTGA